jgi:branched-chain amino acid aminotransferase
MKSEYNISIKKIAKSNLKDFDFRNFTFGKTPTDHIFIAEYKDNEWTDCRIEPFRDLTLSPLALCFHYGQTVFEGMKAFRCKDGSVNIFRPFDHQKRFNRSLERMCMPSVPEDLFINAISKLVDLDKEWLNPEVKNVLYIRPFMIATEPKIGVKVSENYLFMVALSPISTYYNKNLKVKVETEFSRAVDGGTGNTKCGGNYGGAFYPTQMANNQGFDQIIWTDAKEHHYIEESGTMNVMFVINNTLITPHLNNTILAGITRDSIITIAKDMGIKVEERKIAYRDLMKAFESGFEVEAFGVGTVAVISPIDTISIMGFEYKCKTAENSIMYTLKNKIEAIRTGTAEDWHGWNYIIQKNSNNPVLIGESLI